MRTFLREFPAGDRDDDPLRDTNIEMLKQRLNDVMHDLTYREREIIRLRYGLPTGYTVHALKKSARFSR